MTSNKVLGTPKQKLSSLIQHVHPARGTVLLLIGALCVACSSDDSDAAATTPTQPGGLTMPPPAAPGAGSMTPPAMTETPDANGTPAAPSGNEGEPGNVDTGMLGGMPASGSGSGTNGGGSQAGENQTPPDDTGNEPPDEGEEVPPPQPATDCPAAALAPGDTTRQLNVGGVNRSYILHVPSTYSGDARVPLLFSFHGLGGNGQQQRNQMGAGNFVAETDAESVVMAFPNGVNSGFDVGECCVDADDVGFTRAMVADIQSVACIDSKRIYATGFSNGGGMSYKLACDAADIFAAVAPGSFQFGTLNVNDCNPSRPISIVAQNGTNDFAVPFEGGPTPVTNTIVFIGAQATFDKWSEFNGCTGPAQDIGNNCTQVSGCEGGTENTLCVIEGGNHEQPRANLLWPILREYTLP
jgi:polyhydroxybutyrate depolymerase